MFEGFTREGHTADRSRHRPGCQPAHYTVPFSFRAMRPDAECGKQMNEPQGQRPSSRWGSALSWGVSPRKNTEETSVFLCVGCVCEEMTEYTHSHSCSCIFWIRSTADFLVGFAETGRNKLRHRVRRMPFKRDSRTL